MENLLQSLRGARYVMFLNTNQLNVCKIVTVQWLLAAILLLKQLQYYPLFIRTKEPTRKGILESHHGVMAFTASVRLRLISVTVDRIFFAANFFFYV